MVDGVLCNFHSRCSGLRPSYLWQPHHRRRSCHCSMGLVHWQCDGHVYSKLRCDLPQTDFLLPGLTLPVAELVSAYPTAGGMYFVTKHVVPPEHVAIWAWVIGWCNFLGQAAGVASLAYTISQMIFAAAVMNSSTLEDGSSAFTP